MPDQHGRHADVTGLTGAHDECNQLYRGLLAVGPVSAALQYVEGYVVSGSIGWGCLVNRIFAATTRKALLSSDSKVTRRRAAATRRVVVTDQSGTDNTEAFKQD